jgi:hypothetical protein
VLQPVACCRFAVAALSMLTGLISLPMQGLHETGAYSTVAEASVSCVLYFLCFARKVYAIDPSTLAAVDFSLCALEQSMASRSVST